MTPRDKLRAALDPKSVAIVGASDSENKMGGRADPLAACRPFAGSAPCQLFGCVNVLEMVQSWRADPLAACRPFAGSAPKAAGLK